MSQLKNRIAVCGMLSAIIMASTPAMAYVEPGTGNLILQLLFGGVAGISLVAKLYWRSLWQGIQNLKPASRQSDPEPVLQPIEDEREH